jgi:hypothetical protein
MINREAALQKIEQIKNSFRDIKFTVYRGKFETLEDQISFYEELVEDLESLINVETTDDFTRPYRGL